MGEIPGFSLGRETLGGLPWGILSTDFPVSGVDHTFLRDSVLDINLWDGGLMLLRLHMQLEFL